VIPTTNQKNGASLGHAAGERTDGRGVFDTADPQLSLLGQLGNHLDSAAQIVYDSPIPFLRRSRELYKNRPFATPSPRAAVPLLPPRPVITNDILCPDFARRWPSRRNQMEANTWIDTRRF